MNLIDQNQIVNTTSCNKVRFLVTSVPLVVLVGATPSFSSIMWPKLYPVRSAEYGVFKKKINIT